MLRTEREKKRVLGCGSLQLEVELAAEALPQRETPRLVDAAAERCVKYQLHAARFVEESLEDERLLRRHHAEERAGVGEIRDDLFRAPERDAGFIHQLTRDAFKS